MEKTNDVKLFFACDDNYIPCFAVVLESIREYMNENRDYYVRVLHSGNISQLNMNKIINEYSSKNLIIEFVDISSKISNICEKLHTRDYYSKSTYFRLFIPNLYPNIDKALYLDCDIVLLDDVGKLYDIDLENNLVGGATDEAVSGVPAFRDYVETRIGVPTYKNYFNAGVLLMNLKKLREINFEDLFIELISKVTFNVAQDQDYLNVICKDRVKYISKFWNKMPIDRNEFEDKELKLIHYNLSFKPWHIDGVNYEEIFWSFADKCIFKDEIHKIKDNFDITQQEKSDLQTVKLMGTCKEQSEDCQTNKNITEIIYQIKQKYALN